MPINLNSNEINSLGVKLLNNTSYVTSNLVSLWDAGIPASYPGSGNSWYEFVDSSSRTGTLTNGPTYSSADGGSIVFDGSNDQVRFSTFSLPGVPWSVSFWIKTTTTAQCALFSHWDGGPVYNGFGLNNGYLQYTYYNNNGWNYSPLSNTLVNTNRWVYVTYATGAGSTSTFTFYTNGVASGTFTPVSNGIGSGNMGVFGLYWGWGYYTGHMAHCSIHNTQLSATQILQNFNATRLRFGV